MKLRRRNFRPGRLSVVDREETVPAQYHIPVKGRKMMRIVSLLLLFCSLSFASAAQKQKIPATLSEAHAELERIQKAKAAMRD